MAYPLISNITSSTFDWQVCELGNSFNSNHYIQAGIAKNPVVEGSTSPPSGIIDSQYTSGTGYAPKDTIKVENYYHELSVGSHYVYGFAQTARGKYYQAGSAYITIPEPAIPPAIQSIHCSINSNGWTDKSTYDIGAYYSKGNSNIVRAWIALCITGTNTVVNGYQNIIENPSTNYIGLSNIKTPVNNLHDYSIVVSVRDVNNCVTTKSQKIIVGKDETAPILVGAGLYLDSKTNFGKLTVVCNAKDEGLGLSAMYVKVSNANPGNSPSWSSQKRVYFNSNGVAVYEFSSDVNGKDFVNGANYKVAVDIHDRGGNILYQTPEITYKIAKPSKWSWSASATNAFTNKGAFSNFTASEWNSFVKKVETVYNWYAGTNVDMSNNYSNKGDVLTATSFNNVRGLIETYVNTGVAVQNKGDVVKGEYFIKLANGVNTILDLRP